MAQQQDTTATELREQGLYTATVNGHEHYWVASEGDEGGYMLHTPDEWFDTATADWGIDAEGRLTFQGDVFAGGGLTAADLTDTEFTANENHFWGQIGSETVMGTDWPVIAEITRCDPGTTDEGEPVGAGVVHMAPDDQQPHRCVRDPHGHGRWRRRRRRDRRMGDAAHGRRLMSEREMQEVEKQAEARAWKVWQDKSVTWGNTESGAHVHGWISGRDWARLEASAQLAASEAARAALVAERDQWRSMIRVHEFDDGTYIVGVHMDRWEEARALLAQPASGGGEAPPHPFTPCCSNPEAICEWTSSDGVRCVGDRDEPCHVVSGSHRP